MSRTRAASLPLLAIFAMLSLSACKEEAAPEAAIPRSVRVVAVALAPVGLDNQSSGQIQARYSAAVGFLVGGRLIDRKVDIGSLVKKGDVLANIDPVDMENQLSGVKSQLAAAQADVNRDAAQEQRQGKLLKDGYTTQSKYDDALRSLKASQAHVAELNANLRLAQDQLNYTTLKADNDGVVTATGADPGQVVTSGQMVVQISQLGEREGVFGVAEKRVIRAAIGMPVKVWLQSDPSVVVRGAIREIAPSADPTTGTYAVKITLPNAPDAMRLGAVVVGQVDIKGNDTAVIPSNALLQSGNQPAVWVADRSDSAVHKRQVKVLRFDADTVAISEGLKAGELVVTAGINILVDGQKVTIPEMVPPPAQDATLPAGTQ
jgi:RND family efflux transporter MFP subunit